ELHLSILIADVTVALLVVPLAIAALRFAATLQRSKNYSASIAAIYVAYALAFTATGLLVLPEVDRWQDLGALARRIKRDSGASDLAVLDPSESPPASPDQRLRMAFTALAAPPGEVGRVVADWFDRR